MSSFPGSEDQFEYCDYCGEQFDLGVRYPAITRETGDDSLGIFSFCDTACKAAWRAEK